MDEQTKAKRLSVTKLQRQQAEVVELISLCQTVTADGTLADDEIAELDAWANANANLDLPARDHLLQTIRAITADGVVTEAERMDLYRAIERILPPDIRSDVKGVRIERERQAKEEASQARQRELDEARLVRAINKPRARFNFMVAGIRHEGRSEIARQHANAGDTVTIVREIGNPFSSYAIKIEMADGKCLGYVPEELARTLAPSLDSGSKYDACITKLLTGGRYCIPVVEIQTYAPTASLLDLRLADESRYEARPDDRPVKAAIEANKTKPRSSSGGCLGVVALATGSALITILWRL
jgi:hypothetical protein